MIVLLSITAFFLARTACEQTTTQPWPLSIHKVAGSCCDLYFNHLSHNLTKEIAKLDSITGSESKSFFPKSFHKKEVALLACLLNKVATVTNVENEIETRSVVITTAVHYIHSSAATGEQHFNGFIDKNIMSYSHLQFAIVAAYAEHNNYSHIFVAEQFSNSNGNPKYPFKMKEF